MTTTLTQTPTTDLAPLAAVVDQAKAYAQQSKAANTRRAYAADWRNFTAWCEAHHLAPLPAAPEAVALYVTSLSETSKVSTAE